MRTWENMRLRGYDYLSRSRPESALEFFEKGREFAADLGSNNYRYAFSLVDLATVLAEQGDLSTAKKLLRQSISIFESSSKSDARLKTELINDEIRSYCQLANLEIKLKSPPEKILKIFNKVSALIGTPPYELLNALSRRQLADALIAFGDFARAKQQTDMAKSSYQQAFDLSSNLNNYSDLLKLAKRRLDRELTGQETETASDLLERGVSRLKRRDFVQARSLLNRAAEIAEQTNDPASMQVQYQIARLDIGESRYEDAEANLLALLENPNFKDSTGRNDVLEKLTLIYRAAGMTDAILETLRQRRTQMIAEFGKDSKKVNEVELEHARTLIAAGRNEEAVPICTRVLKFHKEIGEGDGGDSERLAGALVRCGQFAIARPMVEQMVNSFQSGNAKNRLWGTLSCVDLATLNAAEKRKGEVLPALQAIEPLLDGLESRDRLILSESLIASAIFLPAGGDGALFLQYAVKALPDKLERRDAIRLNIEIEDIRELRTKFPEAFDASLNTRLDALQASANKFPPVKLKGLSESH